MPFSHVTTARTMARAFRSATLVAAGLALAGCVTPAADVTGSISNASPEARQQMTEAYGRRYDANPKDAKAALQFAVALRAADQNQQALAVLQQATLANAGNTEVLAAYGKALLDNNRAAEAAEVLARAHRPERPDWRILSAQGAAADQLGDHATAQRYYEAALRLAPGEPGIMSNLGLSYALSKRLPEGERVLTEAAASPRADRRVRQNLALVLGLEGKFREAEVVLRQDFTPEESAAMLASFRRMVAQPNSWDAIRRAGRAPGNREALPNG